MTGENALADDGELLAVLRSTAFVPGSNVRGERAGAPWSFLLPTMELGRILVLGAIDAATERTLRRLARDVTIVASGEGDVDASGHDLVVVPATLGDEAAAVVRRTADLVAPGGAIFLLAGDDGAAEACIAAAAEAGLEVCLDGEARPPAGELVAALAGGEPGIAALVARLAIIPRRASTPVAVPGWMPHRFVPHARGALRVRRRLVAAATEGLQRTPSGRRAIVLQRPRAGAAGASHRVSMSGAERRGPDPLPEWLGTLARAHGHDLTGRPWAFVARGDYDSQKPVIVIADAAGERAEIVVKVTRNPAWNDRLAIEERALLRLGPAARTWRHLVVPSVAFSGTHAGLAVLAETAVVGRPYAAAVQGSDEGPGFEAAVDAVIELAASTRRATAGATHASAIEPLVEQFATIWSVGAAERDALDRDLSAIAAVADLPAVVIHGDAGTHNMLVTESGRVALVDWEAAEDAGPPLWDLERLASSRAMLDRPGRRPMSTADRARRHLIDGSAVTPRLGAAIQRYADALAIPRTVIGPLIRTAWVARALKEVNRLRAGELERGLHQRLVRLSITAPGPGWRALTGRS